MTDHLFSSRRNFLLTCSALSALIATKLAAAGLDPVSVAPTAAGPALNTGGPIHAANSRIVKFEAKPEPIAIDTAKTAVIVIDMQNDFGTKGGMFDRAGIDISGIQMVIDPTARVLAVELHPKLIH